ncbi:cuticle protein 19.8 isoform X2 [Maniola jurtina]|uniref:cuticle protein 19.8 isoform X2 n=1 Tax=Maniola jurtina TaxID=191418 RepID=UPI001E68F6E7|nr:cuticle protein 19.8 isoform X2 [Maniola jurtina]
MLRQCITLAVLGCAFASPVAQYPIQQQDEGIPPHLLRQYIGGGQAQAQHIPHPAAQPAPAPARLPYNVQEEQYQPRAQYQPQPQPQPQQQYRPQQQREPEDYDPHPSYQFGFDVSDDKFTNYQNRQEQRDGDQIKGSYSVVDSDGFIRTVTYTADPKEGFRAEVSRKPTDIVVKYPTPKPPVVQPQGPPQQQAAYQPQIQQQQHQPQQQQQRPQQANPQYYRYE